MKLKEYSRILNLEYKHCVVLVKFGNFYKCFDNDALIIFYLLNYKIKEDSVGFPTSCLGKVLLTLKENNISSIVVNDYNNIMNVEVIKNNYDKVLNDSKKYLNYKEGLEVLINDIDNLLKKDINNFSKIKKLLNGLN